MRRKLFLSVAIATLSLSLPPAYAQSAGAHMTGATAKPGETATQNKAERAEGAVRTRQEESQTRRDEAQIRHEGPQTGRAETLNNREESGKKRDQAQMKQDEEQIKREEAKSRHGERSASHPGERHGAAGTSATNHNGPLEPGAAKERAAERAQAVEKERRASEAETGRTAGRASESNRQRAEDRLQQQQNERALGRSAQQPESSTIGRSATDQTNPGATATQHSSQGRESIGAASRPGQAPARVQLSQRQQSEVRDIIGRSNVPNISRNDFNVQIGAVVPPYVQYYPLPPDVISMIPQYQGYDYVMVDNQIAIIDPGTRTVVSMLGDNGPPPAVYGYEEGGGYAGGSYDQRDRRRYGYGRRDEGQYAGRRERRGEVYGYAPRVRLDTRQERALYRGVMSESRPNLRQVCVKVGERVPDSVDIEPVPRNIVADSPDIERYDYFVLNDQVVLVDPDSRVVVDIIQEPR